jgi:hypothetical protein
VLCPCVRCCDAQQAFVVFTSGHDSLILRLLAELTAATAVSTETHGASTSTGGAAADGAGVSAGECV